MLADTDLTPFDAGTFGSGTTPRMVPQLRRVAASARELLLDLAAKRLSVDRATLSVSEGKVVHAASQRSLTFGELAKDQHFTKTVSYDTPVTPPAKWKTEGTSVPKVDGAAIVTGRHRYASDIRLPGMLFGKILRTPSLNAKLKSVDLKAARAMPRRHGRSRRRLRRRRGSHAHAGRRGPRRDSGRVDDAGETRLRPAFVRGPQEIARRFEFRF